MYQFPRLLRPLWGNVLWRMSASSKVIYLTFDDGPVPEVTPQVLDILDKHQVKASFFCVGDNVYKYPQIYADVLSRGHVVGNHSFHHVKGYATPTSAYLQNVALAAQYIKSNLFRPPHGQITYRQRKALSKHYRIVMWDIITYDYNKSIAPEAILKIIRKYTRNGSIIVFHDSIKASDNMLEVLPKAILWWKEQGFQFATL